MATSKPIAPQWRCQADMPRAWCRPGNLCGFCKPDESEKRTKRASDPREKRRPAVVAPRATTRKTTAAKRGRTEAAGVPAAARDGDGATRSSRRNLWRRYVDPQARVRVERFDYSSPAVRERQLGLMKEHLEYLRTREREEAQRLVDAAAFARQRERWGVEVQSCRERAERMKTSPLPTWGDTQHERDHAECERRYAVLVEAERIIAEGQQSTLRPGLRPETACIGRWSLEHNDRQIVAALGAGWTPARLRKAREDLYKRFPELRPAWRDPDYAAL